MTLRPTSELSDRRQRRRAEQRGRRSDAASSPPACEPSASQRRCPTDPGARSLDDVLAEYLVDLESQGRSPRTRAGYQLFLGQFISFAEEQLGHRPCLADVTLPLAKDYALHLQRRRGRYANNRFWVADDRPLSPFTVVAHLRALKAFSSWLATPGQELLESNRLAPLKLPRLPGPIVRSVTQADFERVLASCDRQTASGCRDGAILCLIFDAGPRLGEVVDAQLDDLDLANRSLRIRWETAKTHRERTIYFGPRTTQWLNRYVRLFRPSEPPSGALNIFLTLPTKHGLDGGDPLSESAVEQMFRRRCHKAGVEPFSPHRGRHTFGPNFLLGGGDEFTLQQTLGHATRYTTAIYARMRQDQIRQQHRRAAPLERWGRRPPDR